MSKRSAALLQLLKDDDPVTVALVKEQLARGGVAALPGLRALLANADPEAAASLREVVQEIEGRQADVVFGHLCESFSEDGDLEEAAWRLAAVFLPGEDFAPQRALLDVWGAEVSRRLVKAGSEAERIETLVEYLAHELRLRGNEGDYYNLNNSLLPEVIDTRLGLPISLSLVYMLVGHRAGLAVDGVGLPGHFIIRHRADFFDPFHGGRRLGLEECRALVQRAGGTLTPAHLEPTPPRLILLRMLTNLYALAVPSDPELAEKLQRWRLALASSGEGKAS